MEDCCSGVEHLVREGLVDPDKVTIDGGSAGGYTTLACLTFKDTFKAGEPLESRQGPVTVTCVKRGPVIVVNFGMGASCYDLFETGLVTMICLE